MATVIRSFHVPFAKDYQIACVAVPASLSAQRIVGVVEPGKTIGRKLVCYVGLLRRRVWYGSGQRAIILVGPPNQAHRSQPSQAMRLEIFLAYKSDPVTYYFRKSLFWWWNTTPAILQLLQLKKEMGEEATNLYRSPSVRSIVTDSPFFLGGPPPGPLGVFLRNYFFFLAKLTPSRLQNRKTNWKRLRPVKHLHNSV